MVIAHKIDILGVRVNKAEKLVQRALERGKYQIYERQAKLDRYETGEQEIAIESKRIKRQGEQETKRKTTKKEETVVIIINTS